MFLLPQIWDDSISQEQQTKQPDCKEREISLSLHQDLSQSWALFCMLLSIFCHLFSEAMVQYFILESQPGTYLSVAVTCVPEQYHCSPERAPQGRPAVPTHLPHWPLCCPCLAGRRTWALPGTPSAPPHRVATDTAWAKWPRRDSVLLLHQLSGLVCGLSHICQIYFSNTWRKPRLWALHAKNGELEPIFFL